MDDADAALAFLRHHGSSAASSIDERRLVRKIDLMIMPLLLLVYNLQYLDKTLINYAAVGCLFSTMRRTSRLLSARYRQVMGLYQDTGLTTDQFSLVALIFYVAYLVFELPSSLAMQRLPTAKYLGANGALNAATE